MPLRAQVSAEASVHIKVANWTGGIYKHQWSRAKKWWHIAEKYALQEACKFRFDHDTFKRSVLHVLP